MPSSHASIDETSFSPDGAAQREHEGSVNAATPEEQAAHGSGEKQQEGSLSQTPEDDHYITGVKLLLVIGSLSLVSFLMLLDISIVATPTFLVFFAIFELGSLLCGVATSSKMLIIARAIAGLGGSGLINGALTIISSSIPMHKRPIYMGALMGIGQMGVVAGPLIGGAFTEYVSWRWCFYINLPIGGLVAIFLILIKIPDAVEPRTLSVWEIVRTKLDLIGFLLFAPATIQLLLALNYGGVTYPWNSSTVIGLFCGAGATFLVFLAWEYRKGDDAMVPPSMIKVRAVWASCLVAFWFFSMLQLVIYYLPIYFQAVKGTTPMMSGVDLLPSILSQLVGTLFSGAGVTKLGYYVPFVVAGNILASIGHGLLSTLDPNSSSGKWIGYQVIVGFGRGLGLQMAFVAVQNAVPPAMVSISMSILTFTQTLGGSVMLTIGQTIFNTSLKTLLPQYAPGVDPSLVIEAGATGIRQVITDKTMLANVLVAYSKSIDRVFYLAIGCSCASFVFSWWMGFKDIRKSKKPKVEEANAN